MDDLLPINLRLFLESLRGKTDTVTEKNFSKQDLEALKTIAYKHYVKGPANAKINEQHEIARNKEQYPTQSMLRMYDETNAKSYTPGKQVGYSEYSPMPDLNNWADAGRRTFTDPMFRIGTSLGNFGLEDKGDHYRAYDTYNWNGDFDIPINSLGDVFTQGMPTRPTSILNALAELFAPKVNRPVDIKIPK